MKTLRMISAHARAWSIGLLLTATACLASHLQPKQHLRDHEPKIELATMIPGQFSGWKMEASGSETSTSDQQRSKLNALYEQHIERTYIDKNHRRIMLSIAYGSDQLNDRMQAHRPEYCYKAQGFTLTQAFDSALTTPQGLLPIRRLLATRPGRSEPITYWLTIGNRALLPGPARKIAQLQHGLSGNIPDGLLIRVSSLDRNTSVAYALHDRFLLDLLSALGQPARFRLAGNTLQYGRPEQGLMP